MPGFITLVAGSSVIAAAINHVVTAFRDGRRTTKDASFSALYLAIALESYASDCAWALGNSEDYETSDGQAGSPHGNVPDLPDYPTSIEWKPLGIKKATQAMSFRVSVGTAKAMLRGLWDVTDEDHAVPAMREQTAKLGQAALNLAVAFRAEWKIEPVDYGADWNVQTYLDEKVALYAEKKQRREERDRQFNDEIFGIVEQKKDDAPQRF